MRDSVTAPPFEFGHRLDDKTYASIHPVESLISRIYCALVVLERRTVPSGRKGALNA